MSEIKVETKFQRGVKLSKSKRFESLTVFSSGDFKVDFEYGTLEDSQLVLHSVSPIDQNSNQYNLTV